MDQQEDKSESEHGQDPVPSSEEIYVSTTETPSQDKAGPSKKLTRWPPRRFLELIFTGTVAFFTIVLAGVSYKQWMVMERQGDIMENTLLASQRPWISVDYTIGSDLKFSPEEGRIIVRFNMKNVGTSPAVGVAINAAFQLLSPHHGDMLAEQGKICASGRANLRPGEFSAGDTLFPGQERLWEINLPISRADMERSWADMAETHKHKPGTTISPVLVGCASYRSTLNGKVHKTRFIASLSKMDPTNGRIRFSIDRSDGNVPSTTRARRRWFHVWWKLRRLKPTLIQVQSIGRHDKSP